jgi:AcrR family transcriptional regulator
MTVQRTPRGPYKKGIERRQEIVKVAVEVFGQYGFKGGTLQQVGDKVGLTPAAIIKLFGSKEKLLIAVLEHWGVVTGGIVGPEAKGYQRLDGFKRLMAYHVEHPGLLELYTTMAAEATSVEHPAHGFMTARYHASREDMRRLFSDAVNEGRFRRMNQEEITHEAEFLLAIMDGLEIQFLLNPAFDLQKSFSAFLNRLDQRLKPDMPQGDLKAQIVQSERK